MDAGEKSADKVGGDDVQSRQSASVDNFYARRIEPVRLKEVIYRFCPVGEGAFFVAVVS